MDVFGDHWRDHHLNIARAWSAAVSPQDLVLVPGDISWAMKRADALPDLKFLNDLPGFKLLTKGNHDFWWPNKKRDFRLENLPSMRFLHGRTLRIGAVGIAATRGWMIPGDTWFRPEDQSIFDKEIGFLETALQGLGDAQLRICMLHYPAFDDRLEPSGFVDLLQKYNVQNLVFGHLHGEESWNRTVVGKRDGIEYHLTSCDYLGFKPKLIATTAEVIQRW